MTNVARGKVLIGVGLVMLVLGLVALVAGELALVGNCLGVGIVSLVAGLFVSSAAKRKSGPRRISPERLDILRASGIPDRFIELLASLPARNTDIGSYFGDRTLEHAGEAF